MITEISLQDVACYKSRVNVPITKEVTLFYGLNGAGKSTLSNFLYNSTDIDYSSCKLQKSGDVEVLVYNQKFIEDFFFEDNALKGVFTLSKENKDIKKQIEEEENKEKSKILELKKKNDELSENLSTYNKIKSGAVDKVWEIKTTYTGGDRVLEYCIKGLMKKDKLYEHLKSIKASPDSLPHTIESLKNRASALVDENAIQSTPLSKLNPEAFIFSEESLLSKKISSSSEGPVAEFIEILGNSNWVKEGLAFITTTDNDIAQCPFCQQATLTNQLLSSIKALFDGKYKEDLTTLEECLKIYKTSINAIDLIADQYHFKEDEIKIWDATSKTLTYSLETNIQKVEYKISHPQEEVTLISVAEEIELINNIITKINKRIIEYNKAITNRKKSLEEVKNKFWEQMRKDYAQTLEGDERARKNYAGKKIILEKEASTIESELSNIRSRLINLRKKTVNIDASVDAINSKLLDLGISGFKIKKFDNSMYRLAREGKNNKVFRSLSEGEKTLISFLYFIERCHGSLDPSKSTSTKSVVIDDPISSLSHIYISTQAKVIQNLLPN